MRKKWHILLYLIASSTITAYSQDQPKNSIRFAFGPYWAKTQDLVYSPMIFSGGSFGGVGLEYARMSDKRIHEAGININQADIESTELLTFNIGSLGERQPSSVNLIQLYYRHYWKLMDRSKLSLWGGAMFENQALIHEYLFGFNDDTGFVISYSLMPVLKLFYQPSEKHQLSADLGISALAFVARPEYATVDNEEIQNDGSDYFYHHRDGQIHSIFGFYNAYFSVKYKYSLSRRFGTTAALQFRQLSHSEPLEVAATSTNLNFGFDLSF